MINKAPEAVSVFLDDYYTKTMLGEIGAYVARTLELTHMQAESCPSEITKTYLREATRTYVHGLPQACVALSRAALEQSLKDVLGHQLSGTYLTFQALVDDASKWGVLDKLTAKIARKLAKEGDAVLHEKAHRPREGQRGLDRSTRTGATDILIARWLLALQLTAPWADFPVCFHTPSNP